MPTGASSTEHRPSTGPPFTGFDVVTGAFSNTGRAIADHLLQSGRRVRTLTGHPERRSPSSPVEARPLEFADRAGLVESMRGAATLYNTYWVRFAHGSTTHDHAVANTRALFEAAAEAGAQRIVHVSITHPDVGSTDSYFRGKALVEQALTETGVPCAIVRPGILFGGQAVLLNNIAWLLRHLPVFAVGGDGRYRVRPVHVDDLARLCVTLAADGGDRIVADAVGPERPTFLELVTQIRDATRSRARIVRVPGPVVPVLSRMLGRVMRDVLLTRDEYVALASGLADTDGPATGTTSVAGWIEANAKVLGRGYVNEVRLHYRPSRGGPPAGGATWPEGAGPAGG
jgi:nucleoside-diphosphate-sugar epimerase